MLEFKHTSEFTDAEFEALKVFVREYCSSQSLVTNDGLVEKFINDLRTVGQTVLAVEDESVLGVINWVVVPYHFTGDPVMKKMAWFVMPGERGQEIGRGLLDKAEEIAKADGALVSFLSIPKQYKLPSSYIHFETSYVKVL